MSFIAVNLPVSVIDIRSRAMYSSCFIQLKEVIFSLRTYGIEDPVNQEGNKDYGITVIPHHNKFPEFRLTSFPDAGEAAQGQEGGASLTSLGLRVFVKGLRFCDVIVVFDLLVNFESVLTVLDDDMVSMFELWSQMRLSESSGSVYEECLRAIVYLIVAAEFNEKEKRFAADCLLLISLIDLYESAVVPEKSNAIVGVVTTGFECLPPSCDGLTGPDDHGPMISTG
ncbi:hypothetical protein F511_32906 [Dorcoceras hygrometricum]|uniref:Uncharacterized protein n=1 Tax=Dorcoceras hygrometricum TaxID=472368 RepID=A0A2Z7BTX6_9LAMI|nr:hypothetical protein F511_32906 [Dorcoceras hygrometricum]